jgi:DnaK suppressor protein
VAELAAKRVELERELGELAAPTGDASGISFGKRVGEGTSLAVERLSQVAAHDRLRAMLEDVRRAEAKLAEGSYGTCDRCGAAIPPERLDALPWAVLCLACSARR